VSIVFVFMGFEPAIELNNNNNNCYQLSGEWRGIYNFHRVHKL